jgi:hypothetical protein
MVRDGGDALYTVDGEKYGDASLEEMETCLLQRFGRRKTNSGERKIKPFFYKKSIIIYVLAKFDWMCPKVRCWVCAQLRLSR